MSWDFVYTWSQAGAVLCAAIALVSGFVVTKRQNKELLTLGLELEAQKQATIKAESARLELEQLVKDPRTLNIARANEILDWSAPANVAIAYPVNNQEVAELAESLLSVLFQHAGWSATANPSIMAPAPPAGVTLVIPGPTVMLINPELETLSGPASALYRILRECVSGNPSGVTVRSDPSVAAESLAITIGPKY